MNILIKLIVCFSFATTCSFAIAIAVLFVLTWIVDIFKLNYGRDAYWVFSVASLAFIISWIIAFGLFMSEEKIIRPMSKDTPPALVPKTRKNLPEPIHYFSTSAKENILKTIYKYQLQITDTQTIKMPRWTELLSAQFQGENLCVWALVNTEEVAMEDRVFRILGTGHKIDFEIEDSSKDFNDECFKFFATVQQPTMPLVWHIFTKI